MALEGFLGHGERSSGCRGGECDDDDGVEEDGGVGGALEVLGISSLLLVLLSRRLSLRELICNQK